MGEIRTEGWYYIVLRVQTNQVRHQELRITLLLVITPNFNAT